MTVIEPAHQDEIAEGLARARAHISEILAGVYSPDENELASLIDELSDSPVTPAEVVSLASAVGEEISSSANLSVEYVIDYVMASDRIVVSTYSAAPDDTAVFRKSRSLQTQWDSVTHVVARIFEKACELIPQVQQEADEHDRTVQTYRRTEL